MEAEIDNIQKEMTSELNDEMSKVDIKSADSLNEPDSFQKELDSQNEPKSQNEPDSLNDQDEDSITTDSEKKETGMKIEKEAISNIQWCAY